MTFLRTMEPARLKKALLNNNLPSLACVLRPMARVIEAKTILRPLASLPPPHSTRRLVLTLETRKQMERPLNLKPTAPLLPSNTRMSSQCSTW